MGQTSDMARALFVGSLSLLSVSVSLRNAGRENLSRFPGTAGGGTEELVSARSSHCQSHTLSCSLSLVWSGLCASQWSWHDVPH